MALRAKGTPICVDSRGFVRADGIVVGRRVLRGSKPVLQLADKDRRRASERGTRFVEITAEELGEALEDGAASFDTPLRGTQDAEGGRLDGSP